MDPTEAWTQVHLSPKPWCSSPFLWGTQWIPQVDLALCSYLWRCQLFSHFLGQSSKTRTLHGLLPPTNSHSSYPTRWDSEQISCLLSSSTVPIWVPPDCSKAPKLTWFQCSCPTGVTCIPLIPLPTSLEFCHTYIAAVTIFVSSVSC